MNTSEDTADDKPVFRLFDESKGARKWFYYLQDDASIMGPFKPTEMKHWVIATPVMMSLKVYCTETNVPDEWSLTGDAAKFMAVPLSDLLMAARDGAEAPVWSYDEVKEHMVVSGHKAQVAAHENPQPKGGTQAAMVADQFRAMNMRHGDHAGGRGEHGNDSRMRPGRGSARYSARGQGRGGRQHSARSEAHEARGVMPNQAESYNLGQLQRVTEALQQQQPQQQPQQQHAQQHARQAMQHHLQQHAQQAMQQHAQQAMQQHAQQAMQQHAQQAMQQQVQQPMQHGGLGGSGGSFEESNMDWGALSVDDSPMKPPSWGASVSTTTAGVGYNPNAHDSVLHGRGRTVGMGSGRGPVPHGALFAQAMGNASRSQQQSMGPERGHAPNVRHMGGGHQHAFDHRSALNASLGGRGMGQGHSHGRSDEPMVAIPLQALGGSMGEVSMPDTNTAAGANLQHTRQQAVNVQNSTAHSYKQGAAHSLEMHKIVENSIGENVASRSGMPRSPQGPHADGAGFGRFGAGGRGMGSRAPGYVGGRGGQGEGRLDSRFQSSGSSQEAINPRAEMMLGAIKDMRSHQRIFMHDDRASHRRHDSGGGQHTFNHNDSDFATSGEVRNAAPLEAQSDDTPLHDSNDTDGTVAEAVQPKVEEDSQLPGVEDTPASAVDDTPSQVSTNAPPVCPTSDQSIAIDTQAKKEAESEAAVTEGDTAL